MGNGGTGGRNGGVGSCLTGGVNWGGGGKLGGYKLGGVVN